MPKSSLYEEGPRTEMVTGKINEETHRPALAIRHYFKKKKGEREGEKPYTK